jgi:hypothetical protein
MSLSSIKLLGIFPDSPSGNENLWDFFGKKRRKPTKKSAGSFEKNWQKKFKIKPKKMQKKRAMEASKFQKNMKKFAQKSASKIQKKCAKFLPKIRLFGSFAAGKKQPKNAKNEGSWRHQKWPKNRQKMSGFGGVRHQKIYGFFGVILPKVRVFRGLESRHWPIYSL